MQIQWVQAAALACALVAPVSPPILAAPRADGQLEIEVVDVATGQPIPARMHLQNARKRPVKLGVPNTAEFGGHFYVDGRLTLPLRRGQFTFEIDAGPEYRLQTGHFEIERHADDTKEFEVTRFADLAKEGWYAADLDFDRNPRYLPLILRAEHLQDVRASEFATILGSGTGGRALGTTKKQNPLSPAPNPQSPVLRDKVALAPAANAWNLPVWLASGSVDAIQLIHRDWTQDGDDNDNGGRPRDQTLFPGRTGNGRWSETIYYHVLNCGLRIPPVAGSGSGINDRPVGANRVYVHCGDEFAAQGWWRGLDEGRVFVTNGPLLRPCVEGHPPGYVFQLNGAETLTLEVGLKLATRAPIEYLEIIKDGEVFAEVRLDEWKNKQGRLPPVTFQGSGWFLVRAVTSDPKIYQLASSGPYYVEKSGQPRVSRRSAQFLLEWIDATESHIRTLPKLNETERESLLAQQATAREFFQQVLSTANVD